MSGGKETPRQKMIGMMYLVLTALLALNVSKSILHAFVTVNESLVQTTENFGEKNNTAYGAFDNAYAENEAKTKEWFNKAQEVKEASLEMMSYLEGLKSNILEQTHGWEKGVALGPGPDGYDTCLSLAAESKVTSLDNYDVPAASMGLADPAAPAKNPDNDFDALTLVDNIHGYRDALIAMYPPDHGDIKGLGVAFDLGVMMEHGVEVSWMVGSFYHAPLAACITHLSKIEADVKNAEADIIKYLFSQVDAGSYKFNKLAPAVIAPSSYLLKGDTFRAEVFLAAFDTTSDPLITFAPQYLDSNAHTFGADTLGLANMVIRDGKGIISIPADAEGVFSLSGLIQFKGPDGGYIPYPVSTSYQVAAPSLTVSASKMNVFYKGVDNPVSISAPGVPADKVSPSISNGSIKKAGKDGYMVKVSSGTTTTISVSGMMPDGSKTAMGKVEFRVKSVPDPKPYFAGKGVGDSKVKKNQLTAAQGVAARMENFDFDLKFSVTSFKLTMIVGGTPIEKTSKGNRLSGDMKIMLKKAKPGQKVYIEDIRAKGPDGTVRKLGSLAFKVI
jgi:gliding motility-associated protein GldM